MMCNKNIKSIFFRLGILALFILLFIHCGSKSVENEEEVKGLKDYYADNYLIGVALFPELFDDSLSAGLIRSNFNSVTPENDMKWALLHPTLDTYRFDRADKIVEYTQASDTKLIGHTLVWHSQLGKGVFTKKGSEDQNDLVDSETLLSRIKDHISTVAGRYKGKVHGWDVVNEALNEDGTLRETNFLKIAGDTYIEKAFEYAHKADPDAELYYNDYNLVKPEKRQGAVKLIKRLQEKGLRVDAVGIQAH